MKRYVLAVLMLAATTASTLAAEEGKVIQVIYVGKAEDERGLVYQQFDETGAVRVCTFFPYIQLGYFPCRPWVKPTPER